MPFTSRLDCSKPRNSVWFGSRAEGEAGVFGEISVEADGFGNVVNVIAVGIGAEHAGIEIELLEVNALGVCPEVEIEIKGGGGFAGERQLAAVE